MTKYAGRDLVLGIAAPNIAGTLTSVASTDIFTNTGTNGFAAGDAVFFSNLVGGAGLTVGKRYYVIATSLTATTFMVSTTVGVTMTARSIFRNFSISTKPSAVAAGGV